MDSQVTLINVAPVHPQLDGYTVLQLDTDNVHNCRISVWGNPHESFAVESNPAVSFTRINHVRDTSSTLIATIERRSIIPDTVTLGEDREPMRIYKWLKTKLLSDFPATMDISGRLYTWNTTLLGQLTMCAAEEPNSPLAVFSKSQTRQDHDQGTMTYTPARLVIKNEVSDVRDVILVACLILEHKVRMMDKRRPAPSASGVAPWA